MPVRGVGLGGGGGPGGVGTSRGRLVATAQLAGGVASTLADTVTTWTVESGVAEYAADGKALRLPVAPPTDAVIGWWLRVLTADSVLTAPAEEVRWVFVPWSLVMTASGALNTQVTIEFRTNATTGTIKLSLRLDPTSRLPRLRPLEYSVTGAGGAVHRAAVEVREAVVAASRAAAGGGGLDTAAVDARIAAGVQIWARDDSTAIPAGKLVNAPGGLTQAQVEALVHTWALAGSSDLVNRTSIIEDFSISVHLGDSAYRVTGARVPANVKGRVIEYVIDNNTFTGTAAALHALPAVSGSPPLTTANALRWETSTGDVFWLARGTDGDFWASADDVGDFDVSLAAIDIDVAPWARLSNADRIPAGKIPPPADGSIAKAKLVQAVQDTLEDAVQIDGVSVSGNDLVVAGDGGRSRSVTLPRELPDPRADDAHKVARQNAAGDDYEVVDAPWLTEAQVKAEIRPEAQVDVTTLTPEQQSAARTRIGAGSGGGGLTESQVKAEIRVEAQTDVAALNASQKTAARDRIGAGTSSITEAEVKAEIRPEAQADLASLTTQQQQAARTRIGAGSGGGGLTESQVKAEIRVEAQTDVATLTDQQKTAARDRIGAGTGTGDADFTDAETKRLKEIIHEVSDEGGWADGGGEVANAYFSSPPTLTQAQAATYSASWAATATGAQYVVVRIPAAIVNPTVDEGDLRWVISTDDDPLAVDQRSTNWTRLGAAAGWVYYRSGQFDAVAGSLHLEQFGELEWEGAPHVLNNQNLFPVYAPYLPRRGLSTDTAPTQRAVSDALDSALTDGVEAWGPARAYGAARSLVGMTAGTIRSLSTHEIAIYPYDAADRALILASTAMRTERRNVNPRLYALGSRVGISVSPRGAGRVHIRTTRTPAGVGEEVLSLAAPASGRVRVETANPPLVGRIIYFNNVLKGAQRATWYRVISRGSNWFEIWETGALTETGGGGLWLEASPGGFQSAGGINISAVERLTPIGWRLTLDGSGAVSHGNVNQGDVISITGLTGISPTEVYVVHDRTNVNNIFKITIASLASSVTIDTADSNILSIHADASLTAGLGGPYLRFPDNLLTQRGIAALSAAAGQASGTNILDNLVGVQRRITLSQAQSRINITVGTSTTSARTSLVNLPATAAAGDRLRIRWDWHDRPTAVNPELSELTIGIATTALGVPVERHAVSILNEDGGYLEWMLPAGATQVLFEGRLLPVRPTLPETAAIDVSQAVMHDGPQSVGDYAEAIAGTEAAQALGHAQVYTQNQINELRGTVADWIDDVVRRPLSVRAWGRFADQAAALAGVAAATWSNTGRGTAPTGAYWDLADVPSGTHDIWLLQAQARPTAGSGTAWTFGSWGAVQVTNAPQPNVQFSEPVTPRVWHNTYSAARTKMRDWNPLAGQWGGERDVAQADAIGDWERICSGQVNWPSSRWQGGSFNLISEQDMRTWRDCKVHLAIYSSTGTHLRRGTAYIPVYPNIIAAPYAQHDGSAPLYQLASSVVVWCDSPGTSAIMENSLRGQFCFKFIRSAAGSAHWITNQIRVYEADTGNRIYFAIYVR